MWTYLLEELVGLVGLSEGEVLGDIDLEASVRGDGKRLPRVERVLGRGVESSNRSHGEREREKEKREREGKRWWVREQGQLNLARSLFDPPELTHCAPPPVELTARLEPAR